MRGRTGSAVMYGIPEEIGEEWEGPVGVVKAEERAGLSGEIGAVVSGLSQFKAELLQLHAIVSPFFSSCESIHLSLSLYIAIAKQ